VRIALVSPYSWTYPGGVNHHVSSLAAQLTAGGHDTVIFAPYDPDDERARRNHHGLRPAHDSQPKDFVSLGRTVGVRANGAMSNLAITRSAALTARRALREGGFDVAHLHEPVAPAVCWDLLRSATVPLVGTFHTYSTNDLTNGVAAWPLGGRLRMRRLAQRIAVSQAAAWTARRYYGGDYQIIPNGVDIDSFATTSLPRLAAPEVLSLVFIGQPVARKGLHVLIEAFEQLRDRLGRPVTLTLVGPSREDVRPLIEDPRGIVALGRASESLKRAVLRDADILCAPSLFGESFGMVLTEALAAGTPVVASDIAGYRDVVHQGVEGVLVPPDDPGALSRALGELLADPVRRRRMAAAGRIRAQEFAWPKVAALVESTYEEAIAATPRRVPARPPRARARLSART
jgi:phosphatidylinositol alpha-mannosyltransferase